MLSQWHKVSFCTLLLWNLTDYIFISIWYIYHKNDLWGIIFTAEDLMPYFYLRVRSHYRYWMSMRDWSAFFCYVSSPNDQVSAVWESFMKQITSARENNWNISFKIWLLYKWTCLGTDAYHLYNTHGKWIIMDRSTRMASTLLI